MRESSKTRGFPVLGIAVAGLVLGHLATYALLWPDPHRRGIELSTSGHAYLPAFAHLACILAALAAATIVAKAWGGREDGPASSFLSLVGALAVTQASAFVGQEILERAVSGSSLHDLFSGPMLAVGVGTQLVFAAVGAAVAIWLRRTVERVAAAAPPGRVGLLRPRAQLRLVAADNGLVTWTFAGARRGRSPPSV